ncbi:MAG: 5-bromo-4-chloroindolyl phosphate hydrolysis family protein [Oscillospiraceae bacterium]
MEPNEKPPVNGGEPRQSGTYGAGGGTGRNDYRGTQNSFEINWGFLTSWPFIVVAFAVGLWPVGLFLIFKGASLSEEQKRRRTVSQATQTRSASAGTKTATATRSAAKSQTRQKKKTGSGLGFIIAGAILAISGLGAVYDTVDMIAFLGSFSGYLGELWTNLTILAAGGGMLWFGIGKRRQQRRFPLYLSVVGGRRAVPLQEIASAMGLSLRKVVKDLQKMVETGWFPAGAYLDMGRGYYFADASAVPEEKPKEEPRKEPEKSSEGYDAILRNIRELNDRIADEALSRQIDKIEDISRKIFREVERCPEKKGQIGTLLNYYLPTTQKLLDSYATFEAAGVEGENMSQAKARIESTMERIVRGFEKQLDQLYSADAMDVESDIRVMESMLNRDEASTEKDFGLKL